MDYLSLAVAWPRFVDGSLRAAKREALCDFVAPALSSLQADGTVALWTHTFWGDDEVLGTNVVLSIVGAPEGGTAADAIADAFAERGLEAGTDFRVEQPYEPERMERFWGDHLETWLETKARLSSLAVAAIRGELGESYGWHWRQNRPGHVWANQLGLTYMDEAGVYQRLARGYLEEVPGGNMTEPQRETMDRVKEHMDAAAELLPEPSTED